LYSFIFQDDNFSLALQVPSPQSSSQPVNQSINLQSIIATIHTMADQASNDAAAKARIIQHMNANHQRSLSYYLQHFNQLSARAATSKPLLRDMTFSSLTIQSTDGKLHIVPLNPPLKSWAEARARVVEMDREARAALGISSIAITAYEPPRSPFHVAVFGLCVLTFVVFGARKWIVEGTWVYDAVLPWFPGGPRWFLGIARAIALPVVGIHLGVAYWLDKSRLRKHGIERGMALWYKWIGSCFIEGVGCFHRIDAMVKRKTLEAEKARH
jgi:hypothetical protein